MSKARLSPPRGRTAPRSSKTRALRFEILRDLGAAELAALCAAVEEMYDALLVASLAAENSAIDADSERGVALHGRWGSPEVSDLQKFGDRIARAFERYPHESQEEQERVVLLPLKREEWWPFLMTKRSGEEESRKPGSEQESTSSSDSSAVERSPIPLSEAELSLIRSNLHQLAPECRLRVHSMHMGSLGNINFTGSGEPIERLGVIGEMVYTRQEIKRAAQLRNEREEIAIDRERQVATVEVGLARYRAYKEVVTDMLGVDALQTRAGRDLLQSLINGSVQLEALLDTGAISLPPRTDDVEMERLVPSDDEKQLTPVWTS